MINAELLFFQHKIQGLTDYECPGYFKWVVGLRFKDKSDRNNEKAWRSKGCPAGPRKFCHEIFWFFSVFIDFQFENGIVLASIVI